MVSPEEAPARAEANADVVTGVRTTPKQRGRSKRDSRIRAGAAEEEEDEDEDADFRRRSARRR